MRNFMLIVAYEGTSYCGWQAQGNGDSIQERLEAAWACVTREALRVIGSGRTDAGVHALGQVVSVRSNTKLGPETLQRAINANLPHDIRVISATSVPWDFHAIRSALGKHYRYLIHDGEVPDPMERRHVWFVPQQLNLESMQQAAKWLEGEHNFAAFQGSGSPRKDTVRHVRQLAVTRFSAEFGTRIRIDIRANGFLYNMARNIVGTLVWVGQGRCHPDQMRSILESLNRRQAGATAPAHGLCLVSVIYGLNPNPEGENHAFRADELHFPSDRHDADTPC
jgi:tRNA pseudouridine38-40 synthase